MAKLNKEIHTPNTKMGHSDNYGSAIRNKVCRTVDVTGAVNAKIKVKSPPKALA